MAPKTLSIVLHTVEALVVLGVSLLVAYLAPEYKGEAFTLIFAVLSTLAKTARVSDAVPINDYINPPEKE